MVCAFAHVISCPLASTAPGAGRVAFCCGARLARVEAPAKGRMGFHPIPRFSRAEPAAAIFHQMNSSVILGAPSACRSYPKAAGEQRAPAVRVATIGRVVCAGWLTLGSSLSASHAMRPGLRGSVSILQQQHTASSLVAAPLLARVRFVPRVRPFLRLVSP